MEQVSHQVFGIKELLCYIIDYLPPLDATLFYTSIQNEYYKKRNIKRSFLLPDIEMYWKLKVENAVPEHKKLADVFFRLGYYANKPLNYMDIYKRIHMKTICSRSGCYQWFQECDSTLCLYHPGYKKVYSRRSKLTCCDAKDFDEPGCCSMTYHDGSFYNLTNLPRI